MTDWQTGIIFICASTGQILKPISIKISVLATKSVT